MNLLLNDLPTSVIDVNGTLYFDTDILSDEDSEYTGKCITYDINTSNRIIIEIMIMYETANLNEWDKADCMLEMLYKQVPKDREQAQEKAIEFLNCGKYKDSEFSKYKKDYGRLYSFEQDGNFIFSAINFSHNDILKSNPDLHWMEFVNKFMQLKDNCQFNHILANRLAFKEGKMTDEQKKERKEYPEIYILGEQRKIDDEKLRKFKEMQDKLNS